MTGIDDRYEAPPDPDLVVTPDLGLAPATELVIELIATASLPSPGRAPATT
jgi:adenylylsulfate kinase-like enzyme